MFAGKAKTEKQRDGGGDNNGNGDSGGSVVAVAIDKDRGSQHAIKWAIDNLLSRGQTVLLLHVKLKQFPPSRNNQILTTADEFADKQMNPQIKDLFLPFRCFCTRKDIQCVDFIIEDVDVVKGLVECVNQAAIEHLVIGLSTKNGFLRRFKEKDIPGNASKVTPDFCTVYVISKGKLASRRPAIRSAPSMSSICSQAMSSTSISRGRRTSMMHPMELQRSFPDPTESMRSPLTRERGYTGKSYGEFSAPDTDISFVCSERPSVDRLFPSLYDNTDIVKSPRFSNGSDRDYFGYETPQHGRQSVDVNSPNAYSSMSYESDRSPWSSQAMNDVESEMRRLKLELKQTMDMYSSACKEALTAKQKARELQRWKFEEEGKVEEARMAEEAAIALVEKEKAKSRAAIEAAETAHRIAELEAQKGKNAEMKALREAEEKRRALDALAQKDVRYRKYTIEEIKTATEFFADSLKIGEGGYGPVYKCYMEHTSVAIKVLRPDAAQGRSQFQQEVEVLSCLRHPNMVLLLGACPEYGCLVYEYMGNGSLDDRLFRRGNTPPLPWQLRFKIAAEIGTGLLFLHQSKPEPLVHRDLKPGNILLDNNFVSKICDVGLSRLVPPSVADSVTQYWMTSTAGTFCYIDPEYQQTGMLGIKSDIYSLGIMFLQLITAKPPMGLSHHVSRAIENGTFAEFLDPSVLDWPIEEALSFAKMALKCAELRRKDRPDLGKEVLPELNRLKALGEGNIHHGISGASACPSPRHSQVLARQEVMTDHQPPLSETSSRGGSPTSPCHERVRSNVMIEK